MILNHLDAALVKLQLDPRKTVIVSDIGCVGLSDQYFVTNTFHGLHGRSVAYATGIKLANPELHVLVTMGDGGCGIGGTHLINAARRNIGVTVLVFNNFNFGMTGGEHSVTTPPCAITATTRHGNIEQPLDVCATVAANGASYVYRGTSFDKDLADRIAEAIQHEGFSLLDIWELCTAYFAPNNEFSRTALIETLSALKFPTGVIRQESRPEYAREYRRVYQVTNDSKGVEGNVSGAQRGSPPQFAPKLDHKVSIVVAGSAGGKVRSAARLLGQAATLCGSPTTGLRLWAAQRDDYPVTVNTGHSVSEIILSPQEIRFTGVSHPDVLIVLSENGYQKVAHYLPRLTAENWLFVVPEFAELETRARKMVVDLSRVARKNTALAMITVVTQVMGWLPVEALQEAARQSQPAELVQENLRAIAVGATMGEELLRQWTSKGM